MNPKIISLLAMSAILAGLFGYALSIKSPVLAVIAGLVWASLFTLKVFLIDSRRISIGSIILESAAMVFWLFSFVDWRFAAVTGVLMILTMVSAYQFGRGAINNAFKIRFFSLAKLISAAAMTAAALLITAAALPSYNFQNPRLARDFFDKTVIIAESFLPGQFNNLAPTDRAKIYQQLFDLTLGRLYTLPAQIQKLIIIGIAILVFLTVKGALVFVGWATTGIAFLFYQALRKLKFFSIELESRSKEIIKL